MNLSSTNDLLSALITQALADVEPTAADVEHWFSREGVTLMECNQPPPHDLSETAFSRILQKRNVVLVLDALDECGDIRTVLALLTKLTSKLRRLRVLITSRPHVGINRAWTKWEQTKYLNTYSVDVKPHMVSSDLELYIGNALDELLEAGELTFQDPQLRDEIIQTLLKNSHGM